MTAARNLLGLLLLAAWAVAAHGASVSTSAAHWHVLLALAPLLLALALLLRQTPMHRALRLALALLALGLIARQWDWLRQHKTWLFYLEYLGSYLALGWWFARSLLAGQEPLVSSMARLIQGRPLSPRHARYTRAVTGVWALFFLLNALLSTLLFALAPITLWSMHANLFTGPAMALLFGLEMLVRRQVLPAEERPSISQVVHAYRSQHSP